MAGLIEVVLLLTIVPVCVPLSIDRQLLTALKKEDNDDVVANGIAGQRWDDYKIPNFEGDYVKLQIDILMSLEEAARTYTNRTFNGPRGGKYQGRRKRSAIHDWKKLWPLNMIPYSIDEAFAPAQQLVIRNAMDHWKRFTCLDFVPKAEKDYAHLKFENDENNRCESFVGYQNLPQPIFLAEKCVHVDIVIHEIGHAIGLYHEHTRPDRDDFVTINYTNIENKDSYFNFDKGSWSAYNNYSKPYDYLSIMHYGSDSFSRDHKANLMTIVPTNSTFTDKIGNAKTISFHDAWIVNKMYNCSESCQKKACPKEGFLGKSCQCYCPGSEGEPKLCEQQTVCDKPPIDQSIYIVYDDHGETEVFDLDKDYNEGATLGVYFIEDEKCGFEGTQMKCTRSVWEGLLPICQLKPCLVPNMWTSVDGIQALDGNVTHGTNLSIACRTRTNAYLAECDAGTLLNSETKGAVGDNSCCKDTVYRIINNDERSCTVKYNDHVEYSITQGGVRIINGSIVGHMETVEAKCDHPDVNNDFDPEDLKTSMKCIDGHWDNEPPARCPQVSRHCGIVANATLIGPLTSQGNGDVYKVECIQGYSLHTATSQFTFTKQDGWIPSVPECRPGIIVKKPCSLVVNAIVTETSSEDKYTVKCIEGYELNAAPSFQFSCAIDGKWLPRAPFCKPKSCSIPMSYNDNKLSTDTGERVTRGSTLPHTTRLTPRCSRGEVPTMSQITCHLGTWQTARNTPTNAMPICNKVICPTTLIHPVRQTSASPEVSNTEYVYGDTIRIEGQKCDGILELIGPDEILCQKDGTWSGEIICRKFCEFGTQKFRTKRKKNLKVKARGTVKFGDFSREKCERKCLNETRFLCKAISYGYDRKRGYLCKWYDVGVNGSASLKYQNRWVVAERYCKN